MHCHSEIIEIEIWSILIQKALHQFELDRIDAEVGARGVILAPRTATTVSA
jgi:hypothetical protein